MYFSINPKDIVSFKKLPFSRYLVNDIVKIKKDNNILIHRIIFKRNNYVITKVDDSLKSDGKIHPGQIVGKVSKINLNGQVMGLDLVYILQSTVYFREIKRIKNRFNRRNIPYVILKGLPLYLYYEKSHPGRIYWDCDILIDKNASKQVKKIFIENGYKLIDSSYSHFHKLLKDKTTEINFIKKVNGLPILFDVHFEPVFLMNQIGKLNSLYPENLMNKMTYDFLISKRTVKIQNELYSILDTPYLIFYLSLHFFHHNYRGIHRLDLLSKIIRNSGKTLNWEKIAELSASYEVNNFIYPVFLLISKYFGINIPETFMKELKSKKSELKYIKSKILNTPIFDDESRIESGINRFKNLFFLTEQPFRKKVLVFVNPAIIYSVFWILWIKLLRGLRLSNYEPDTSNNPDIICQ